MTDQEPVDIVAKFESEGLGVVTVTLRIPGRPSVSGTVPVAPDVPIDAYRMAIQEAGDGALFAVKDEGLAATHMLRDLHSLGKQTDA
jgi:hypothetical protein